jgi:hypothetical protein
MIELDKLQTSTCTIDQKIKKNKRISEAIDPSNVQNLREWCGVLALAL